MSAPAGEETNIALRPPGCIRFIKTSNQLYVVYGIHFFVKAVSS